MANTTTLQTIILLRRAAFEDTCILALGEPGYHTGTKELKIGDGSTAWKNLPFANQEQIEALIAAGVAEAKEYADGKVASVNKEAGTAITVDNSDSKNPKIGLDLNNTGNVILSQTDAGLSANIDLSGYELTDTTYTFSNGTTDGTFVVTPEGGSAQTVKIGGMTAAEALAEAKKYADENDANDNTAHNHVDGIGIKASGGGISGDATLDLNVAFDFIKSGDKITKVVLYDKDDTSKTEIASFETSAFIKDGMLHDVEYDAATNKLTFTWNTDAGSKTDEVTLTDILDPYIFEAGAKLDVTVDGTKVTYSHKTVTAPTETAGTGRKYLTGVTTDGYGHITGFTTASETDQDLSNYKTLQEVKGDDLAGATVVGEWEQDENGVITIGTRQLTPADIGAKAVQTAVSDPTANGSTLTFIDTISQNTQGVITATKKSVDLSNYYTKREIDDMDHEDTTYTFEATENALEFTVTPDGKGSAQTITLVAPTVDVGVTKVTAGTDIVVTPEDGTGAVTVAHATYSTGTVKDAAHDSAEDPSFITGITINNGHVTGATVQNLKAVLENMIFVLDGGENGSTLVIG